MRILVVEDEQHLRNQLMAQLDKEGYAVAGAADGKEGWFLASEYPMDLAVIDLGLPELDGISLIKKIRAADFTFPIIILTARGRWQDKVEGLDAGADDYLTKPFSSEELLARLNALIRRSKGFSQSIIESGPIKVDTRGQMVTVAGNEINLTAYEYHILEYLMLNMGEVISKTVLTEHIYDQDFDRDSNVVEVLVGRLRKKIDPGNTYKPIETLRGRGYRISH